MSFQPITPLSGYSGWLFLQRTLDQQVTAYNESAPIQRSVETFRNGIQDVQTAEELVKNREVLSLVLGAFGLEEDINNKYFVQNIIEGGVADDDSLANRLSDTRYAELARTLNPTGADTINITDVESVIDKFERKSFEAAVGESDNDLRLALSVESSLGEITSSVTTEDARWYAVLGNAPLREVIQTALGFPSEIASLDIDKQVDVFKARSQATFGTDDVGDFMDSENQEDIIRLFLLRSEISNNQIFSSSNIALTLLSQ